MKKLGSSVSSGPSMRSDRSKHNLPDLRGEVESIKSSDSGYTSSVSSFSGSSLSAGRVMCDACDHTAVKRCLTCMASYCGTHVKNHYTSPELERHQLQDLPHQGLCEQHHKKLELYCRTDQLAICLRCLLQNHMTHDVIEQSPQETSSKSLIRKDIPPPGPIQFTSVQPDSVSLSWSPPEGAPGPHRFRVTWRGGQKQHSMVVGRLGLKVTELIPGEKYNFAVATLNENDHQTSYVEKSVHTEVPPPENLTVDLRSLTAFLKWTKPAGVDQVSYLLELFRNQKSVEAITRDSPNYTITGLQYGGDYTISVHTALNNGRQSKPSRRNFKIGIPLKLVLLGVSGSGKSASGNTILGENVFKSEPSLWPVTTECKMMSKFYHGSEVQVIDTPDFVDDMLQIQGKHVMECRTLCEGGQCVYLLVIQIGCFTEGKRDMIERLEKALDTRVRDRTIILFTRGDDLGLQPIDDYIKNTTPYLQQLISKCGNRYHVFNNNNMEAEQQVQELMLKVTTLVRETDRVQICPEYAVPPPLPPRLSRTVQSSLREHLTPEQHHALCKGLYENI